MSAASRKGEPGGRSKKKPPRAAGTPQPSRKAQALRDFEWTDDLIKRYAYSNKDVEALPANARPLPPPVDGEWLAAYAYIYRHVHTCICTRVFQRHA
jgi:hypothetical protein